MSRFCWLAPSSACSGEVIWMRRILDKYHEAAKEKNVRIVHCCGFDSVPSDLGTCLVVDHLNSLGKYVLHTRACVHSLLKTPHNRSCLQALLPYAQLCATCIATTFCFHVSMCFAICHGSTKSRRQHGTPVTRQHELAMSCFCGSSESSPSCTMFILASNLLKSAATRLTADKQNSASSCLSCCWQ